MGPHTALRQGNQHTLTAVAVSIYSLVSVLNSLSCHGSFPQPITFLCKVCQHVRLKLNNDFLLYAFMNLKVLLPLNQKNTSTKSDHNGNYGKIYPL